MSRQVQLRRGTAIQHQTFTGLIGELTMNTTNNSLRLHDNVLNGGHEMLKADMSNVLISNNGTFSLLDNLGQVSVRITNVADPVDNQDVATKAWVLANAGGGGNIGNFTFTNGDITNIVDNYINLQASDYSQLESNGNYVWVDNTGTHIETFGGHVWWFDTNGDLKLPAGGDILDNNGNSILLSIQGELDTTQSSLGLNVDGSLPIYSSNNYILNTDSHHVAIGKLDTELSNKLDSADFNAENIITIVNDNNTGLNADLLDGLDSADFVQVTSLDTIAGNVLNAIPTLDASGHIKTTQLPDLAITSVSSGLLADRPAPDVNNIGDVYITTDTNQTFISTGTGWSEILNPNATAITELQTELDTTQNNLGLNVDGSRPVYSSNNYIDNIDTHHVAIGKLDSAIATKLDSADFNAENIIGIINLNNTGLNADTLDGLDSTNFVQTSALDVNDGNIPTLDINGKIKNTQISLASTDLTDTNNLPRLDALSNAFVGDIEADNLLLNGTLDVTGDTTLAIAYATTPDPNDNSTRIATTAWVLANTGGNNVGNFTFTNGTITNTVDNYINIQASDYAQLQSNNSYIWVELDGAHIETLGGEWWFDNNGNLRLPFGGGILDNNGNSVLVSYLNDLSDVTITDPSSTSEVLKYNGAGQFVNAQLSLADLSDGNNTTPKLEVIVKTTNYTSESNKIYLNDDFDNLIVTLHNIADIGDVFFVQVNHDFSSTTVNTTFASVLYKGQIYSNPNNLVLSNNTTGLYQFRYMNDGIDSYWYVTALGSSLHTLNNVDIDAITNGQTIVWDALNNKFIPHDIDGQAIQDEVNAIETTLGGYIDGNGEWVQPNGTNYLDGTTDFSNAISTLDSTLNTVSNAVNALNPNNYFQIANLFSEILGNVASQNTAKTNLGLVDDQGRFIESIDYGSVTDNVIGSSIDFQDATGTGGTPLNAEDLFITTVYYSLEDYGCLIG